ncbi:hypothetical protein ONS95_013460 [Cadophora gregata]|uniref:uncharacterized protein n=1 Tax=Cadophora gregata TaxID=51156 RepID=UPI0026DD50C4|nr:uncharacterized protein ONS95_013460 [Cadophora gregata]KAK0116445.1 hypothetical protein ONS95_013460 [Cadophora gregata]
MKLSTLIAILSATAPAVLSKVTVMDPNFVPPLDDSILDKPSVAKFIDPNVPTLVFKDVISHRDDEPDPDRPITLQDGLVFVLQCVLAGFREPCLVFGAPPGKCVSYFNFQPVNDTSVSNTYNNAVSSISTNTGGYCQFYKYRGCDNRGDDRGVTMSYEYDLAVASDGYSGDYDNIITSWRC